ncbi:MAG: hypothetical protein FJX54_15195 [Alphaproteobacteria bacterium]|nr:hypothetical protein [Alphaproteobacteria bacterium]
MDRRNFLKLLAVGAAPTSFLAGESALSYRQVQLDATVRPEEGRRIFSRELDTAKKRHPVYVVYYQEDSPHRASYQKAVAAVLAKRRYRGAVIFVDVDRHLDLAKNNHFDVNGRPYTLSASLSAFVDGELMSFYRTSIESEVDGTRFNLSYPGIAGVTGGPLGDDIEKLKSRISGFVERTDQAFASK